MRYLLIFLLLPMCYSAKAEYNTTIYTLEFHTVEGSKVGYFETQFLSPKQLKAPYLLNDRFGRTGNFYFFKELLKYNYASWGAEEGELAFSYLLIERDSLLLENIDSISVIDTIVWSYLFGSAMVDDVKANESDWLKELALYNVHVSFELCEYDIMIHEESPEALEFLEKVRTMSNQISIAYKRVEDAFLNGEEEDQNAAGKYYWKVESELSNELMELFEQYNSLKVVVITFCTC